MKVDARNRLEHELADATRRLQQCEADIVRCLGGNVNAGVHGMSWGSPIVRRDRADREAARGRQAAGEAAARVKSAARPT